MSTHPQLSWVLVTKSSELHPPPHNSSTGGSWLGQKWQGGRAMPTLGQTAANAWLPCGNEKLMALRDPSVLLSTPHSFKAKDWQQTSSETTFLWNFFCYSFGFLHFLKSYSLLIKPVHDSSVLNPVSRAPDLTETYAIILKQNIDYLILWQYSCSTRNLT